MSIKMLWQIAAGSHGRDYSDRFLRHGIAFVGGENHCATMKKLKVDDIIILKRGLYQILAVGVVVERYGLWQSEGKKQWLRDFDGWNLPAWCNVDWHVPPDPYITHGLTRTTIQNVYEPHLVDIANFLISDLPRRTSYENEPPPTEIITDEDLISELIDFGLRPSAAEDLTQALRRIRLLARFYLNRDWKLTKEHEARSFLVVPLLLALGWAEQKIQIEYTINGIGRADIACFRKPVTDYYQNDQCAMIIETKSLVQGLDYAHDQASKYAKKLTNCNIIIVTNGYCYKAFKRTEEEGDFSAYPYAYLNIMNPTKRYPLDPLNVDGAAEVLRLLIPN